MSTALVRQLANDVTGRDQIITTPFGDHVLTYADFTASGRALHSVEAFLHHNVLPFYGNTHTTTSATGLHMTRFREDARHIIAQAVHATDDDAVIFTGSGTTGAVHKLVAALGLDVRLPAFVEPVDRPVVFVGPFEHHSNLLCWRESGADVVVVPEDGSGHVDVAELARRLAQRLDGRRRGHQHAPHARRVGIWDYASAAPYVAIDMNPSGPVAAKDAVYFSGHKLMGGPGSPGVLVVKKQLLRNAVPTIPGGGTVFFVSERDHRYLANPEEREEGGTPDIVGSIRLGLAFQIKQRIGTNTIMALDHAHVARVRASFASNKNLVLLGHDSVAQLPVFSFVVRSGTRFLHYNFVSALLNDLFGVQSRSGCQCAGPYATRLLGIAKADLFAIERHLVQGVEVLRPGSTRFSIPYFMEETEVDFILQAIHFVANHGSKFLSLYRFNTATGQWKHTGAPTTSSVSAPTVRLGDFGFADEPEMTGNRQAADMQRIRRQTFERAHALVSALAARPATTKEVQTLPAACESLRWFAYAQDEISETTVKPVGPFQPQRYVVGDLLRQWDAPHNHAREPSVEYPLRVPQPPTAPEVSSAEPTKKPSPWRKLRAAMKRHDSHHERSQVPLVSGIRVA